MTARALPAVPRVELRAPRPALWAALAAAATVLYLVFRDQWTLPHRDETALFDALLDARDWVEDNRNANPVFAFVIGGIRTSVGWLADSIIDLLLAVPWPAVLAAGTALAYAVSGLRLALGTLLGLGLLGALGLWEPALETLGLTLAAVLIAIAVGVPLGILVARNDRLRAVVTPVLDVMQIMPTFAYLAPMALFFLIGTASAAIATFIYAVPATIRITALGIRGVPGASVEAAQSLGATSGQVLRKVELPLSRRALALAVNQTIMLALSMVVVTVLIDAPGLGENIIRALERGNVGAAFDAGLAIVVLAMLLDRITEQMSHAADRRGGEEGARRRGPDRRLVLAGLGLLVVAGLATGPLAPDLAAAFPEDVLAISFRGPVNDATDWFRTNAFDVTNAIRNGFSAIILNPLDRLLTSAPFWLVIMVAGAIALLLSGVRQAIVAMIALLLIAGLQLWQHAMETLATVLLGTALTLLIGGLLGVLAARSDRVSATLRPVLDAAQTMPSFVYLVPAVALFGPSRFTAIMAAIIFAVPPVVRLVEAGIRLVPSSIVEAARSTGASAGQLLLKVQLPVALPALLLAANQGIIMVLGMVVVGGLVGAGALGYDVVAGFAQREDFGEGLAAGVAIVLLGIMLDRITQGAGRPSNVAARGA